MAVKALVRKTDVEAVRVRKATVRDLESILTIAATVGGNRKDPTQGFLVDDYHGNRTYVRAKFRNALTRLEHFYLAEALGEPVGFMMAYTQEEWLAENPDWMESIHWHPGFHRDLLKDFVVVDKTAIRADLTGQGIGSRFYDHLIGQLKPVGTRTLMAETVIHPVPNFASLNFRMKQSYEMAGTRYEFYDGKVLTDLVYYKRI